MRPSFEADPDAELVRDWLVVRLAWDWGLYDVLKQMHEESRGMRAEPSVIAIRKPLKRP